MHAVYIFPAFMLCSLICMQYKWLFMIDLYSYAYSNANTWINAAQKILLYYARSIYNNKSYWMIFKCIETEEKFCSVLSFFSTYKVFIISTLLASHCENYISKIIYLIGCLQLVEIFCSLVQRLKWVPLK